jgi:hypothetical protein
VTNQTVHPPGGKPQSGPSQAGPAQNGPAQSSSAQPSSAQSASAPASSAQSSSTQSSSTQSSSAKPDATQSRPGESASKARRSADLPPDLPRRRSSGLLLVILMLVVAAIAFAMLSPDQVRQIVAPFMGRTPPSATIAVTPAPGSSDTKTSQAPASSAPERPARPSASSAISPAAPSNLPAVADQLQTLRGGFADLTSRLGNLEQSADNMRAANLANRLDSLEAKMTGLVEQPVVTPNALADALTETRQAAQAAAEESARTVAEDAARTAAEQVAQKTSQEAAQAATRAAQEAVQKATAGHKDLAPALADLDKRLAALEKMAPAVVAIADIEKRLTGLEKMAPAVAAIADLERRLGALEKTAASSSSLTELDRRLTGVEKTAGPLVAQSQNALWGEALALGLLNLRQALDRGAPYADVLGALRIAAASDAVLTAEVDRLAPAAARGAPTIVTLRQRLLALPITETSASPAAKTSSASPDTPTEPAGFWAGIWQRFASVVTVRRLDANAQTTGGSQSGAMGTAVERASARLTSDDLAGAIGLLDDEATRRNLSPAQQTALDDWLRDARARLAAETGFATLSRRSLALFSAKAEAPSSPAAAPTRATPNVAPTTPPSSSSSGQDAATPGDTLPEP